jgi:hypothetical protein
VIIGAVAGMMMPCINADKNLAYHMASLVPGHTQEKCISQLPLHMAAIGLQADGIWVR